MLCKEVEETLKPHLSVSVGIAVIKLPCVIKPNSREQERRVLHDRQFTCASGIALVQTIQTRADRGGQAFAAIVQ